MKTKIETIRVIMTIIKIVADVIAAILKSKEDCRSKEELNTLDEVSKGIESLRFVISKLDEVAQRNHIDNAIDTMSYLADFDSFLKDELSQKDDAAISVVDHYNNSKIIDFI